MNAGTIEERGPGRFRVRATINGKRVELGTWPTRAKAESVLASALRIASDGETMRTGSATLRSIGSAFLLARKKEIRRSIQPDTSRWNNHVLAAPFADEPLRLVTARMVRAWAVDLLSRVSRGHGLLCLALVRAAFRWAIDEGHLDASPARGLELPRARETHEPWTFLDPDEQRALIAAVPDPERWMVLFAMLTGMRRGELWALRLADLHVAPGEQPSVTVRYGTLYGPTKGRKIRTLPLPAPAVEAARRWLAALPTYAKRNPLGLAFPGRYGAHRGDGPPRQWSAWVDAAGIERPVRWHDLRHTCGASLVSGWWGRAWRLEDVRGYLGHANIRQTERYAHLAPSAVREAVSGTGGASLDHHFSAENAMKNHVLLVHENPSQSALILASESTPGTEQGRPALSEAEGTTLPGLAKALRGQVDAWDALDAWTLAMGAGS